MRLNVTYYFVPYVHQNILALLLTRPTGGTHSLDTLDSLSTKELEMVERIVVIAQEDHLQLKLNDYCCGQGACRSTRIDVEAARSVVRQCISFRILARICKKKSNTVCSLAKLPTFGYKDKAFSR